jgi:hypothetical protein
MALIIDGSIICLQKMILHQSIHDINVDGIILYNQH